MAIDQALIDKAVTVLKRFARRPTLDEAVDTLAESGRFDDHEDEWEEIARAAIPLLTGKSAEAVRPLPRPGSRPGDRDNRGGRPAPTQSVLDTLVTAPGRFVVLNDDVAEPERDGDQSRPDPDGVSATIHVTWAAETPLLIGAEGAGGVAAPMTLGNDGKRYFIPGASLRGMLRAATEIVAHARLSGGNLNFSYGLRDFEHKAYGEGLYPVGKVDEVKAGWLTCSGDPEDETTVWSIAPLGDRWAHVAVNEIARAFDVRDDWKLLSLEDKYHYAGMVRDGVVDFETTRPVGMPRTESSKPGGAGGRRVVGIGGPAQGVFVFSDKVTSRDAKKDWDYVFYGTAGVPVPLQDEIVRTFRRLYSTPSRNRPEPMASYKKLYPTLKTGRRVPVFYVGEPGTAAGFFFGFTRLFKVPHERSVRDVLSGQGSGAHARVRARETANGRLSYPADFVENLFGYVVEPQDLDLDGGAAVSPELMARKGRVAFSIALPRPGSPAATLTPEFAAAMLAPRASFAPFYLGGGASGLDYSASKPELAGRKRYLPRGRTWGWADMMAMAAVQEQHLLDAVHGNADRLAKIKANVFSRMRFLTAARPGEDLLFQSRIRLHNVSPAELGAILFALTHGGDPDKPYRHMLGRGKPFGAGQIRVESARLVVTPNNPTVAAEPLAAATPFSPADGEAGQTSHAHGPYLQAFVTFMRGHGAPNYPNGAKPGVVEAPLAEFLGASDPSLTPPPDKMNYQPLASFKKIRDEVKPLKTPKSRPPLRVDRLLAAPRSTRNKFWQV